MTRAIWLQWSALFIALSYNFNNYGALPKPAAPKDFATKDSKPLEQPLTQPVALFNTKEEYACSFNALMQVLWILTPFNSQLRLNCQPDDIISRTYLAGIEAKNKFSEPLFLKPFIDRINAITEPAPLIDETKKGQAPNLTDASEALGAFIGTLSGDTLELFQLHYDEHTYCPNTTDGFIHTDDTSRPDNTYILQRTVTEKSKDLQAALDKPQEQADTCIGRKHRGLKTQTNQHLVTSLTPIPPLPPILVICTNRRQDLASMKKVQLPYSFPLLNLKFGNKLYDLVGVIFHTGEGARGGHYYAWVEDRGTWYKCNDEEIKSFAELQKESQEKNTHYFNFVVPLTQTNLLFYLEKPLHLTQLMQYSFAQAMLQKTQLAVARDVWQQKKASIHQRIKNFGATIEQNLKEQWEPVFQGMQHA